MSPGYDAETVRLPAAVGVTLTEHVAEEVVPDRVQVPPGVNVTVPVGVVGPVAVSVTVAVHDVAWLTNTVDGLHATVVVVGWVPTAIVALPLLVA